MGVYEPKPHKVTVEQAMAASSVVLTVNPRTPGKTALESVANMLLEALERTRWDLPAQMFGIFTTDAQGTRVAADAPGGVLAMVGIPYPEEFADEPIDSVYHTLACRDLSDFDGLSVVAEAFFTDAGRRREARQVLTLLNRQACGTLAARGRPVSAAMHTDEVGGALAGFIATALYGPPTARLPGPSEQVWIRELFTRAGWLNPATTPHPWTVTELMQANGAADMELAAELAEQVVADADQTLMSQCVDGVGEKNDIAVNDALLDWTGGRFGFEQVCDFDWDPRHNRAMHMALRLAELAHPTTPAAVRLSKSADALAAEMGRLRAGDRLHEMTADLRNKFAKGQLSASDQREFGRLQDLESVTSRRVFTMALEMRDPIQWVDWSLTGTRGRYGKSTKKYTRDVARDWNIFLKQVRAPAIPESEWQPIVLYVRELLSKPWDT